MLTDKFGYPIVSEGKRSTISAYLNEIEKSVEMIDDTGILDHTIAKLLPIVTSLQAHLDQPPDDNEELEFTGFEIKEKFLPAQKNQVQLHFNKVKSAGRKRTKLPFK